MLSLASSNETLSHELLKLLDLPEGLDEQRRGRPWTVSALVVAKDPSIQKTDHNLVLSPYMWCPSDAGHQPVTAVLIQHASHAVSPCAVTATERATPISVGNDLPSGQTVQPPNILQNYTNIELLGEALDTTSLLLTICQADNLQVVYQNTGSQRYAGNWSGATSPQSSYLHQLLSLQPPELLNQLLINVAKDKERWTRAVQVPEHILGPTKPVNKFGELSVLSASQVQPVYQDNGYCRSSGRITSPRPLAMYSSSSWLEQCVLDASMTSHVSADHVHGRQISEHSLEGMADSLCDRVSSPPARRLLEGEVASGTATSGVPPSVRARLVSLLSKSSSGISQKNSWPAGQWQQTEDSPGDASQSHPGHSSGATEAIWHEVMVSSLDDGSTGLQAPAVLCPCIARPQYVVIVQHDVTSRSALEQQLMKMTEAQLHMLENMFPRHILELLTTIVSHSSTAIQSLSGKQLGLETAFLDEDPQSPPSKTGLHKEMPYSGATYHNCVTILFTDLVGFTAMSEQVAPHHVMAFLTKLFSAFDELCVKHKVSKIETAGDCYIVCCGLFDEDAQGFQALADESQAWSQTRAARRVLNFATDMLQVASTFTMPNGKPCQQRVGMHSGPVACGLVGQLQPKFSLFGDTMNTSSRMESTSLPGRVQVSEATFKLLRDKVERWECTGGIDIKGKGLMNTYLLRQVAMRQVSLDAADFITTPIPSRLNSPALSLGLPFMHLPPVGTKSNADEDEGKQPSAWQPLAQSAPHPALLEEGSDRFTDPSPIVQDKFAISASYTNATRPAAVKLTFDPLHCPDNFWTMDAVDLVTKPSCTAFARAADQQHKYKTAWIRQASMGNSMLENVPRSSAKPSSTNTSTCHQVIQSDIEPKQITLSKNTSMPVDFLDVLGTLEQQFAHLAILVKTVAGDSPSKLNKSATGSLGVSVAAAINPLTHLGLSRAQSQPTWHQNDSVTVPLTPSQYSVPQSRLIKNCKGSSRKGTSCSAPGMSPLSAQQM